MHFVRLPNALGFNILLYTPIYILFKVPTVILTRFWKEDLFSEELVFKFMILILR